MLDKKFQVFLRKKYGLIRPSPQAASQEVTYQQN